VKFGNLPQDSVFKERFEMFLSNAKYMNHYTPKWDYPISKDDLISQTLDFEKLLDVQSIRTYDLEILQLIVLRYLYNIDAEDISSRIEERVVYLKEKYPKEYRTNWVYGNYLVSSTQIIKGMNEYLYVVRNIRDLKLLHPAFLEDYSYSCLLSRMFKNGLISLEVAAGLRGNDISGYWIYKQLRSMLQLPDVNSNYSDNETWSLQKKDGEYRLFSHILGTSIPIKGDWKLKYTGISDKQSFVMISPQRILSSTGKEIGISVLFQFSLIDTTYDEYVSDIKKKLPVISEEKKEINGVLFNVFVFEDKNKYINMGGSRGYYLVAEIPATKYSNCNIEFPLEITQGSGEEGKVSYYALKTGYDRVEHTVFVGILLDSCNEVFPESSDYFWGLLNQTIFE
jgi:hypothetical protein